MSTYKKLNESERMVWAAAFALSLRESKTLPRPLPRQNAVADAAEAIKSLRLAYEELLEKDTEASRVLKDRFVTDMFVTK